MAIAGTFLTNGSNTTPATSFATASITPTSNRLVLATMSNYRASGSPTLPTASGNGLTWVQVATVLSFSIATPLLRLTTFRALGTASSGAITFDFGGVTQTSGYWSVSEFSGIDTGGTNGSAAVVQNATNRVDSATSLTVTLGAFASANNGAYAIFNFSAGGTATPDTGWTELDDQPSLESQWRADNDTTAAVTVGSGSISGIALELAVPSLVMHGPHLSFQRNRHVMALLR